MPADVLRGNALDLPLADSSVDLIVTSPPYFALRSYRDGGEHYAGQVGSEPTPAAFVDALIAATREMVRVLKPPGSLWVNLGDKYAQDTERSRNGQAGALVGSNPLRSGPVYSGSRTNGVPRKSLIGVPWRYALRCIDELGLILRAEVIWSKPNGLPESVTDRVRRSHETWFHFTVSPRYFAAVDEIREEYSPNQPWGTVRKSAVRAAPGTGGGRTGMQEGVGYADSHHPLGKLPGSVRTVPTAPLRVPAELDVDHFAAFPPAWPAWIIRGWSPSGVCVECGEGRRPVVERQRVQTRKGVDAIRGANDGSVIAMSGGSGFGQRAETTVTITGYACDCPTPDAPTRPSVVLDPFGGTGTTAMAARALGRHGISVDLSADYCRLASWRVNDEAQLAKVTGKPKPRPRKVVEGQASLIDIPA